MTDRLHPPPNVLAISDRLERAGFEAWCVGGAIRDALLGHPHLDWDLATSATPDEVRKLFGPRRTIPVGVEFGTVGVLDPDGVLHEVTTFRRDVKTDGRHAVVEFGASLNEDLARRDFTINAIAYSPSRREVRDPFGGQRDLDSGIVRAVGDAEARMREDRLRALRAIRFAARFDFRIDPATLSAIAGSAPFLGRLSPERVKQELEKTMDQVRRPAQAMSLWKSTGALATLVPALAGIDDNVIAALDGLAVPGPERRPQRRPAQALSLWKSTGALATLVPALAGIDDNVIAALDGLAMPGPERRPQRRLTRLALPFLGLPAAGVQKTLAALRFSRQESNWIAGLAVRWQDVAEPLAAALMAASRPGDAQVRHWVASVGRLQVGPFMRLASAIWCARRVAGVPAPDAPSVRSVYRRMQRAAFRDPVDLHDVVVDGNDLRRAGIPPGPMLGRILEALHQAVLDDPARNTRDWLLHEAERLHAAAGGV